jgi:nucleoside-diphosphate-sugar epimerase
LLGRFVLRELLAAGKEVCVLARRRGPISAHDRVEAIVQFWEQELQTNLVRPKVVEANLSRKGLDVTDQIIDELAGQFTGVLHCAASVRFELDQQGLEPLRSNIDGTAHLVEFCTRVGVQHFHHVSTAYACGRTKSPAMEVAVPSSARFRNPYEYSKAAAERLVLSSPHFASKTIYRPSIVVGRTSDGFANAFHTLYSVLRLAREIEFSDVDGLVERAGMQGEEENNVVPVDWVATTIATIISQPKHWGQTFHLTNPQPTNVSEIIGSIFNAVMRNLPQWQAIPSIAGQDASRDEAFQMHLGAYTNYFHDDPKFDRTNLERVSDISPVPNMGIENLTNVFEFAIQNKFCDSTGMATRKPTAAAKSFVEYLRKAQDNDVVERLKVSVSGVGGGTWHVGLDSPMPASELHLPMWIVELIRDSRITAKEAIELGLVHSNARSAHATELLLSHLIENWQCEEGSHEAPRSRRSPQLSKSGGVSDAN